MRCASDAFLPVQLSRKQHASWSGAYGRSTDGAVVPDLVLSQRTADFVWLGVHEHQNSCLYRCTPSGRFFASFLACGLWGKRRRLGRGDVKTLDFLSRRVLSPVYLSVHRLRSPRSWNFLAWLGRSALCSQ